MTARTFYEQVHLLIAKYHEDHGRCPTHICVPPEALRFLGAAEDDRPKRIMMLKPVWDSPELRVYEFNALRADPKIQARAAEIGCASLPDADEPRKSVPLILNPHWLDPDELARRISSGLSEAGPYLLETAIRDLLRSFGYARGAEQIQAVMTVIKTLPLR